MTAVVVALCVVVALLGLLVVSLLRSHAEILRRLHEIDPAGDGLHDHRTPEDFGVRPGVALPRAESTPAHDLVGTSPDGDELAVSVVGAPATTLLAFLSSGCVTCLEFWTALRSGPSRLPDGVRLVVVTKGEEQESATRVAELAPPGVPVVMSSQAWLDYAVPMAPYFLLVDGPAAVVRGEGAASSWKQLTDLMKQAIGDARGSRGRRPQRAADRESRIDAELAAAGILPGDPSLYPHRGTHP